MGAAAPLPDSWREAGGGADGGGPCHPDWEAFYRGYRALGYVPGYELLHRLGSGVFGVVYKARKESIGKLYAIKFLKLDDPDLTEAVVRELDAIAWLAQIDHPNLVSIEDKGVVDGIPYIVMGYAGEDTLKKRLVRASGDGRRLEEAEALRIFTQVARGAHALHSRSFIHFDIKPANVFLNGDVARLGDYGLSRLVSESRKTLSFSRGTPYYMAPELLRRRGDHRSDIYSMGVMLYEMLAGEVPFKGDSEWEVLRRHESEPVRFPHGFPPRWRPVVARAMEKDPARRHPSAQDLLAELGDGPSPAVRGNPALGLPASGLPGAAAPPWRPAPAPARGHGAGLAGDLVFLAVLPLRAALEVLGLFLRSLVLLPLRIAAGVLRGAAYAVLVLFLLLLVLRLMAAVL